MNPIIITAIIAAAAFIISIFGANFLNLRQTERILDQLDKRMTDNTTRLETKIDGLRGEMKAEFASVGARFDAVDARFVSLESRVDRIERQLDQIFKPALPRAGD